MHIKYTEEFFPVLNIPGRICLCFKASGFSLHFVSFLYLKLLYHF